MKKFLMVALLAAGFTGWPLGGVQAAWESGDRVRLGAYCNLASDLVEGDMFEHAEMRAKQLEEAITAPTLDEGWNNYVDWIAVPDNCADVRINPTVHSVSGALLNKMYEFTVADGSVIEVWLWRDDTGQPGLTWLSPQEEPTIEH